jgi:hypothetical protein
MLSINLYMFKVALAAREKAAAIFYGFNHPRYRDINAQDLFLLLNTPAHLMPLIGKQSVRRLDSSYGEGIDFQQEYRNNVTKQVLPWEGIPSVEQWEKASKVLTHLDEVGEIKIFFNIFVSEQFTSFSPLACLSRLLLLSHCQNLV